jgi:hypothetical protein
MSDWAMNSETTSRTKEILQTICIGLGVLALSLAMAAVDARESVIRFKKGENSTTIQSTWRGENETLTFRAKKGQRISIQLNDGRKSSTKLRATLYKYCGEEYGEPMADRVAKFDGALPCTDQYSIDVSPSSDVALKVDAIEYALTISIR